MPFTALVIVLSAVVICAGSALSVPHEPPLWMVLAVCVATYPVGTALLDLEVLAEVRDGWAGEWSVRLAVASAVTALLSLLVAPAGGEKGSHEERARAPHVRRSASCEHRSH
ncbi:hypothetical protein [Streptomyces sp. NPDC012510]|uniref:hypothetical protein n=1 Tax=Streptomyces sp. NPDC012510 TaxID=3364838 RepID=UPI0036E3EEA4